MKEVALALAPFLALIALFVLADVLWAARSYPRVRWWRLKGTLGFAMALGLGIWLPYLIDPWMDQHHLIDLSAVGDVHGVLAGWLLLELAIYWWHRLVHRCQLLWRFVHRLHHSAERVDLFGSFYLSPLDAAALTVIGSLASVFVLHLSPATAATVNLMAFACSNFQHLNIRTPRWLGYLTQRPEAHLVHHTRGVHASNYANLPLWDMVFGTFVNPRDEPAGPYGFHARASEDR